MNAITRPHDGVVLGIDIDGTKVALATADLAGGRLAVRKLAMRASQGAGPVMARVLAAGRGLAAQTATRSCGRPVAGHRPPVQLPRRGLPVTGLLQQSPGMPEPVPGPAQVSRGQVDDRSRGQRKAERGRLVPGLGDRQLDQLLAALQRSRPGLKHAQLGEDP